MAGFQTPKHAVTVTAGHALHAVGEQTIKDAGSWNK